MAGGDGHEERAMTDKEAASTRSCSWNRHCEAKQERACRKRMLRACTNELGNELSVCRQSLRTNQHARWIYLTRISGTTAGRHSR